MEVRTGFQHRWISGWATDFSSTPRMEPWPSIALDLSLVADLKYAFDKAQSAGYTGIILWGLLAGRSWNPHLPDTVDEHRKRRVLMLIDEIRKRGMKALFGLGLYSWGFEEIIAAHPELDGGAHDKMCGSRPESWEWMKRVVDFVMEEYDPDGVSMQSSDQGRCPCDICQEMGALEYHAMINDRVAGYIRSRWPDKLIGISTWGMDLGNPKERSYVQQMTANVDVLNDFNNSSARDGRQNRRELIQSLRCAFGTEQGWWFDPPPFWNRMKWFLPFSLRNVSYFQELFDDGGRAVERYILPLVNPGAEVGFLFDGFFMQDVNQDPKKTLLQALEMVFEPCDSSGRQGLFDIWQTVENGYIDNIAHPDKPRVISSTQIHYLYPNPGDTLANRPEHLLRMRKEGLQAYGESLRFALKTVQQIKPQLGRKDKAVSLERAILNSLSDVERVLAYRVI